MIPLYINDNIPALNYAIQELYNTYYSTLSTTQNNTNNGTIIVNNVTKPVLPQTAIITSSITLSFGSFVLIPHIILFIILLSTFIYHFKTFVFSKRVLYILLCFVLFVQIFLIIFTCTANILTFNFQPTVSSVFGITYYVFAYFSGILCLLSLVWFTRILYKVYFHEQQYWMSKKGDDGQNATRNLNIIMKPIVKYATIGLAIILFIALPSHVLFVYVTRLVALFLQNRANAAVISKNSLDAEVAFKCVYFIGFVYCAVVNISLSINLARKMTQGSDKSESRKRSARNLILLMIFQTGFILTEGVVIGLSIGAHYQPLILVAIFIFHNSMVLLYILSMSFVYGPLDNLTIDAIKQGVEKVVHKKV
ncbi:hypothetical protein ABK040_007958 [Willaertia magna]